MIHKTSENKLGLYLYFAHERNCPETCRVLLAQGKEICWV